MKEKVRNKPLALANAALNMFSELTTTMLDWLAEKKNYRQLTSTGGDIMRIKWSINLQEKDRRGKYDDEWEEKTEGWDGDDKRRLGDENLGVAVACVDPAIAAAVAVTDPEKPTKGRRLPIFRSKREAIFPTKNISKFLTPLIYLYRL